MYVKDAKELGEIIRKTRKEQGLTQAQVAAVAHVGVRFIVDLERGKETLQIGKALKVCVLLGMKIDVLEG